jgi:hypothetical protein
MPGFNDGMSAETIMGEFDTLTLAQVYGRLRTTWRTRTLLMRTGFSSSGDLRRCAESPKSSQKDYISASKLRVNISVKATRVCEVRFQ